MINKILNYPNIFDVSSGATSTVPSSPKSELQSLSLLFQSSRRELLGDPNFGTNLVALANEYNSAGIQSEIVNDLVLAANIYKPDVGIDPSSISMSSDDDYVYINIGFKIISSNQIGQFELRIDKKENN